MKQTNPGKATQISESDNKVYKIQKNTVLYCIILLYCIALYGASQVWCFTGTTLPSRTCTFWTRSGCATSWRRSSPSERSTTLLSEVSRRCRWDYDGWKRNRKHVRMCVCVCVCVCVLLAHVWKGEGVGLSEFQVISLVSMRVLGHGK